MLSFSHPQTPLDGGLVRSPDARSQPVEFYWPPEHIECSAFLSARDKLAVHGVGTDECGHQRMYAPGHRQRTLPRAVNPDTGLTHAVVDVRRKEHGYRSVRASGAIRAGR
jgi:hypothetical protein